ncbi:hypothetical protein QR66_06780 [Chromobacterium piscinae]|nr:hypothetical protein QR66_06780 [Chromobacterium piscinae]
MVGKAHKYPDFKALSQQIDPEWIAHALAVTGKASVRRRKLPAEQVVWLVIALAMYRHQSIPEVVAHLDLALPDEVNPDIAKSALTQARQRLGEEPLALLFGLSAAAWDERHQHGRTWRGLARYAIDGSTLRASDTPENRHHFGAQAYASGVVASYPQLRLLTLTSLATHLVRATVFGEYGKNEMRYARDLLQAIPDQMLGGELTLRSRAPETVRQEVWGALLAYNLVRLEMAEVAREVGVVPTDLSFTTALHYLRYEWSWLAISSPGTLPARLLRLRERLGELLLPKQRRGRECPRVVKKLPSCYSTKQVRSVK